MKKPLFSPPDSWKKISFSFLFFLFITFSGCIYLFSAGTFAQNSEMNSLADRGRLLWNKHNCTACHQVYGLGGYLGPDLTNFMSKSGKGAEYASAILQEGMGIMPAFQLNQEDVSAIVEFLRFTDSSGNFPGDRSVKQNIKEPEQKIKDEKN